MLVKWNALAGTSENKLGPVTEFFKTLGWVVERVPSCSHGGPKTIGAYLFVHVATGRAYVGSHANLYSRPYQHHSLLARGIHWNKKLQEHFNQDNRFVVFLLPLGDREAAYDAEQSVMDRFKETEWLLNLGFDARTPYAGFQTPEAKREKIRLAMMGRKQSPEHVAARSRALMGHEVSDETIEKIRAKAKERGINPEMTLRAALVNSVPVWVNGTIYPSSVEAGKVHSLSQSAVRKRLASKNFPEWQYARDMLSRPVCIEGDQYGSIEDYSTLTNLNQVVVKLKIDSNADSCKDWRYVD